MGFLADAMGLYLQKDLRERGNHDRIRITGYSDSSLESELRLGWNGQDGECCKAVPPN